MNHAVVVDRRRAIPAEGVGHHKRMASRVGDPDGFGHFGIVDSDPEGVLCHECGRRFAHLGLHAWRGHGITADQYRERHGLPRKGLVADATREAVVANARRTLADKPAFVTARDPVRASRAQRRGEGAISPAGLEAIRDTSRRLRGLRRQGIVVACEWCGVQFCPLLAPGKRRFCTKACASRHNRASRAARRSPG